MRTKFGYNSTFCRAKLWQNRDKTYSQQVTLRAGDTQNTYHLCYENVKSLNTDINICKNYLY